MTSSIYPILPSLSAPIITAPGSGYTTTPTVTIDLPSIVNGTPATGTAVIADAVINAISAIGGTNSGYTDGEEITLSGGTGSNATATAVISGGVISSISFTSRGSGFTGSDVITITGDVSTTATATFTVSTIANDAVSSITITNGGSGYTSLPTITITGGGGSGATATAVFNVKSGVVAITTDILNTDIEITPNMVKPGGGGILRLYFAFVFTTTPGTIQVFNNSALKGNLNADNDSQVVDNGYYRFDIDVESGDNINLQLLIGTGGSSVTAINFIRAHLVQFGA